MDVACAFTLSFQVTEAMFDGSRKNIVNKVERYVKQTTSIGITFAKLDMT